MFYDIHQRSQNGDTVITDDLADMEHQHGYSVAVSRLHTLACLVLYGIACWQTPQLVEFLKAQGLNVTMMQIFLGGVGGYLFLLGKAPSINRRTHLRYESEVIRFKLLSLIHERMLLNGAAESTSLRVVSE